MKNAPLSQLQMIIDIFGVHIEDIAIYLYQNYYTPEKVISYIKKVLTETYNLKEPVVQWHFIIKHCRRKLIKG